MFGFWAKNIWRCSSYRVVTTASNVPRGKFWEKTEIKKINFMIFWSCSINFRTLREKTLGFSQKYFSRIVKATLYVSSEIFWEIHLQQLTKWSYPDCKIETIRRVVIIVFCITLGTIEETFSLQKMIFFRNFGQKFHETPSRKYLQCYWNRVLRV